MSDDFSKRKNYQGLLLLASPALVEPYFRRTIIFITHHTKQTGALGLVLNRPLHLTLGDVMKSKTEALLAPVPIFYGGPVLIDQPALLGIRWNKTQGYDIQIFGSSYTPQNIPNDWHDHLRVFVGHAGWSEGQLEKEIEHNSWLVCAPKPEVLEPCQTEACWRNILSPMGPMLRLYAEAPENPLAN